MSEGNYYRVIGISVGIIAFFGSWIYAATQWGFLLGFGLGWIPSLFIGAILGFTWPIILLGAVIFLGIVMYLARGH